MCGAARARAEQERWCGAAQAPPNESPASLLVHVQRGHTRGRSRWQRLRHAPCTIDEVVSTASKSGGSTSGNRLLDALRRESPALRGLGNLVSPATGTELVRAGQPIRHIYFPVTGVLSIMVETTDGRSSDSLTVGNEGVVSTAVWLGADASLESVVLQAQGEVFRIAAPDFCRALDANRRVRTLLNTYTCYTLRFSYQMVVCNAHHDVEQRACRWLLSAADRAASQTVPLSQTMLAAMIGVRRQTVGMVAVDLQRQGLIETRRNSIRLLDRPAIERFSCECYRQMRELYERILGPLL